MNKTIFFIILTLLLISLFSCEIVSFLVDNQQNARYNCNDFSFSLDSNFTIPDKGNKITSFLLDNILLISYIDLYDNNIHFKYKKTNERNLYSDFFGDILDSQNSPFYLTSGFDFSSSLHPYSYIPVYEKLDANNFVFYFLDSNFYLQKKILKLFYDFTNISYKIFINDSQISSNPVDSGFPQNNNAILYNLKRSDKIGYVSFYNNCAFVVGWEKENLENYIRIIFSLPDYNLTSDLSSTMVEYGVNKIYLANIALNNENANNYLIIYDIELISGTYNKIYESKTEEKIAYNSNIKMYYLEEKNKLYIAWSYKKDGKDYISISELDSSTKKLIDRLKIDITGKSLEDIDIKRLSVNGIDGSKFFIVYSLNDPGSNMLNIGIVNTNNFSTSNWSYDVIKEFPTSESIYSNFADSSYIFINFSRYDNSSSHLLYNLCLIY